MFQKKTHSIFIWGTFYCEKMSQKKNGRIRILKKMIEFFILNIFVLIFSECEFFCDDTVSFIGVLGLRRKLARKKWYKHDLKKMVKFFNSEYF